jgi:hypothetical protein
MLDVQVAEDAMSLGSLPRLDFFALAENNRAGTPVVSGGEGDRTKISVIQIFLDARKRSVACPQDVV